MKDYRYEKNGAIDFHMQRRAFIIVNGKVDFLPAGRDMSHFEYCSSIGMDKETFNKITRGFYLAGDVVFYKGSFVYDDEVIAESLKYVDEIAHFVNEEIVEIYFGELPDENWRYTFHYGKYEKGKIIKY